MEAGGQEGVYVWNLQELRAAVRREGRTVARSCKTDSATKMKCFSARSWLVKNASSVSIRKDSRCVRRSSWARLNESTHTMRWRSSDDQRITCTGEERSKRQIYSYLSVPQGHSFKKDAKELRVPYVVRSSVLAADEMQQTGNLATSAKQQQ